MGHMRLTQPLTEGTNLMPPAPTPRKRSRPCDRCRAHRKKCDEVQPTCARCFEANANCRYDFLDPIRHSVRHSTPDSLSTLVGEELLKSPPSPQKNGKSPFSFHPGSIPHQPAPVIAQILDASDAAILEDTVSGVEQWSLMDPDLLPTLEDFILVKTMFETRGPTHPLLQLFNAHYILDHFYFLAPPLRLALCAKAAHLDFEDLRITSSLLFSYFRRTRRAIMRVLHIPSLGTIQALHLLKNLANATGQSAFAVIIMRHTVDMLLQLRMDVDPDNHSTRCHLPLARKEEYRLWFWVIAQAALIAEANGLHSFMRPIDVTSVKQQGRNVVRASVCERQDIIVRIRRMFSVAPSSVLSLLFPDGWSELALLLGQTQTTCVLFPHHSYAKCLHVLQDALKRSFYEVEKILEDSLTFFASVCMLHRPRLYLFSHLHPQSPYIQDLNCAEALCHSLETCIEASSQIVNIAQLLLSITNYLPSTDIHLPNSTPHKLLEPHDLHWNLGLPLFEAAIALWTLECKVSPTWRSRFAFSGGPISLPNSSAVREGLQVLLETLKLIDSVLQGHPGTFRAAGETTRQNYVSPMILCMEAMLLEIESAQEGVLIENVEIAMTVLSLANDGRDDLYQVQNDAAPVAYMGLLGFQVMGGIKWKGSLEASWKDFWDTLKV
ncbi:hypothetical protein BC830DRAFT_1230860 [Chytriomyces sp. MP71]|nr:hypothetical protein BC830DRAFT_1230860 [Chytriomyces sp. MP71]